MKWAFQLACVLLTILIGLGPASAAVGCVLENSAMGPSCPMGMTGTDADCPKSHTLAAGGCSQDCSNRTAAIVQSVNAVPVKPKLAAAVPQIAGLTTPTGVGGNSHPEVSQNFTANSRARYILLRVFRI